MYMYVYDYLRYIILLRMCGNVRARGHAWYKTSTWAEVESLLKRLMKAV